MHSEALEDTKQELEGAGLTGITCPRGTEQRADLEKMFGPRSNLASQDLNDTSLIVF